MRRTVVALLGFCAIAASASADDAVWQWSVPFGEGRAFLWIPEECAQVRAVVVGQHNMIEEGILDHPTMRRTLAAVGIAEVFIAPPFDRVFQFDRGAGERFDALMRSLADKSGYAELATSPVIPVGHSACASFPWNFAAWNPGRTLAILSIKGDAPLTNLTGSGALNPDWGTRNIDGIPGLMVMSEAEWWDARLAPLMNFRGAHPAAPIAMLADVGHGHFDATAPLIDFLAMFIRKAAEARLPVASDNGTAPVLRPIDPGEGWLVERWRPDGTRHQAASTAARYAGEQSEAFWCFDEEMAVATENYYASTGRRKQQLDFVQRGKPAPIATSHAGVVLDFAPEEDGVTFTLGGTFIEPLPANPPTAAKDHPPPPVVIQPRPAAASTHAIGEVSLSPITGPVVQIAPTTFRVQLNRTASTIDHRRDDIWLLASHPGDDQYKGAVQQALLKIHPNTQGAPQTITFAPIPDQPWGREFIELAATSEQGLPVSYYVREGPARVVENRLKLTALSPRTKFPVTVTVVAWQWGRSTEPKVKTAAPVERSFRLTR